MSSRRTTVPWDKDTAKEVADWLGMLKAPRIPAVPVTKAAANTPEWEAARDGGIGASDIGVIMGTSTFSSPYALWWQKHLHLRLDGNEAMADGHMMEAQVVREFAQRHPEIMVTVPSPALWAHRDNPWAMCTPDRLGVTRGAPLILEGTWTAEAAREARSFNRTTYDPVIVPIEAKWDASPGWGPSGSDEVPPAYELQVMWQAWVLGAPGGWLVNHKPTGRNRYREYWIPVKLDLIDRAWAHARAFMGTLETGVAPDPDGSKATERVLQAVHAAFIADDVADVDPLLAAAWREARDNARAAAARKRELDNRLREAMGKAGIACDAATGAVIARRNVYKRTGYTVAPTLIDELRMVADDGPGLPGGGVPEADGPEGDDAPAGTAREGEALAGREDSAEGAVGDAGAEAAGAAGAAVTQEHDAGILTLDAGILTQVEDALADGRLAITDVFSADPKAVQDVITRCVPAEGIHATPHNGPCILRGTDG